MRTAIAILCGLGILTAAGCAGYQLGAQTLFPPDIHTVYVPMFESDSLRRNLGERLTEAVVKEIEKRTPYKVVGSPNADSVLSGRITQERKNVLFGTRNGDVREYELVLVARVSWVNRRGDLVRQMPGVPVPESLVSFSATAHEVPEYGRSMATETQNEIDKLARQIVSMMETPW